MLNQTLDVYTLLVTFKGEINELFRSSAQEAEERTG